MIQEGPHTRYEGVRVLVADDSLINRRLSRLLMEMCGCRVTCVTTGFQAVNSFREGQFDLILMDCNMPGLGGCEATKIIRNIEDTLGLHERVPIIAVTAFALPDDRTYCIKMGMNDCLIKPLRKEMLLDVLNKWVKVHSLSA